MAKENGDKTIEEMMHTCDFFMHVSAGKFGIAQEYGGPRTWHVGDVGGMDFMEPSYSYSDVDYLIEHGLTCDTGSIEDL